MALSQFFGIVAGRPQSLDDVTIQIGQDPFSAAHLEVYWSLAPYTDVAKGGTPQPADLPLNGGLEPQHFATVMAGWLDRHETWRPARGRFFHGFAQQNRYEISRLIAAANVFDILPASATPKDAAVDDALRAATDECKRMFRALPDSAERSSVLAALGRIGKPALKHKIKYRAGLLSKAFHEKLPDLFWVIDRAVEARNYYVHGGPTKIDYSRSYFETVPFFTDVLEFIFAASDLMEAGWDADGFLEAGTTMSHPFGALLVDYQGRVMRLQKLAS
jgi:hypothetical protein